MSDKIILRFKDRKYANYSEITFHTPNNKDQEAMTLMRDGLIAGGWLAAIVKVSQTEEPL